jgi:hypothetical protein
MNDVAVGMLVRRFPVVVSVEFELIDYPWHQVTDEGVQEVCSLLPALTTLDLNFCRELTDEGVRAMSLNHHGCYKETIDGLNCLRCCRAPLTSLTLPDGEDGIQYTRAGSVCLRHAQRRARPS